MKSVVLMFIGGLVGSMIGPVTALAASAAGYVVGHVLTDLDSVSTKKSSRRVNSTCDR